MQFMYNSCKSISMIMTLLVAETQSFYHSFPRGNYHRFPSGNYYCSFPRGNSTDIQRFPETLDQLMEIF